ncbi:hypothetical protein BPY_14380 [Bifidobacterium psychraerophilum]
MAQNYWRKTTWRPRDERQLSVRTEHRGTPDLGKTHGTADLPDAPGDRATPHREVCFAQSDGIPW